MTQLAGFLDVLLRGISLIGFAIAAGGMAYIHWALRPFEALSPLKARVLRRSLQFVIGGSLVLALSRSLILTRVASVGLGGCRWTLAGRGVLKRRTMPVPFSAAYSWRLGWLAPPPVA